MKTINLVLATIYLHFVTFICCVCKNLKLLAYLFPFYQQLKLFGLVHTFISALFFFFFFSPSVIGGQGIQQLILLTTIISFDKVSIDI